MSINLTYSSDLSESFIKVRHHHSKSTCLPIWKFRSAISQPHFFRLIGFCYRIFNFFLPNRFDVFMRRKRHQNFIWMIGFDRCNLNFRANLSPIHHHHEPNSTALLSPPPVRNGHTSVSTKLGIFWGRAFKYKCINFIISHKNSWNHFISGLK